MQTGTINFPHTFHIPVMGTGFTIDSPLKVGRFGITSVVSIVDDTLAEQMRKYYCDKEGEAFEPIGEEVDDKRAKRFTAYLDLLDLLLGRQMDAIRKESFEPGTDITKYFELLPASETKTLYEDMLSQSDADKKAAMQDELRGMMRAGGIDVNIMTKLDIERYKDGEKLPPEYCDAMSALRGYANSTLDSSIVFSAGLNPRLYGYVNKFADFLPIGGKVPKKKIVLKVSDYRSALIQGKFLAKHALWVSEYRVESGINCGGHAFPTAGSLMGPILDEFRQNKDALRQTVDKVYQRGLKSQSIEQVPEFGPLRLTVQGGIGTFEENEMLHKYYEVDGTGWGTPFMLVPEATTLDDHSIKALAEAGEDEISLSESSPFGIPFWKLTTSLSDIRRKKRIDDGKPGSACPKGFLKYNSEFSEIPICVATRKFIKQKLEQIGGGEFTDKQVASLKETALQKVCLCGDLAGSATITYGIEPDSTTCVCTGPNGAYFDRTYSLQEMVDHIYGRISSLVKPDRPHMFIKELAIYVDYFRDELDRYAMELSERTPKYFEEFKDNLLSGIEHYHELAGQVIEDKKAAFISDLDNLKSEVLKLMGHDAFKGEQT